MASGKKGKNDEAWEKLFDKYGIVKEISRQNRFVISADQIKEFREPRLMAKFDHTINLPRIFLDNRLAILPVSRGQYCIAHFDCYQPIAPVNAQVNRFLLPDHIRSINPADITSEAVSINCALAAGIFADFTGEGNLLPTVSGRMGSGCFEFNISNRKAGGKMPLSVANVQIEIDAALEGKDSLVLVEAKRDIAEDFIIRQLFYPFKTWSQRVPKRVRTIFFTYSNSVFSLYEYAFADAADYNSIQLLRHKNYSIDTADISLRELANVSATVTPRDEPVLPFPQADSFARVINLCEILYQGSLNRDDITQEYAFDVRQTGYYTDAGRYLGLVEKKSVERTPVYSLTEKCRNILELDYKKRQLALCGCIFEHGVFQAVFKEYLKTGTMPDKHEIVLHMKQANLYNIDSESTYYRRASTVGSWLHWVLSLTA